MRTPSALRTDMGIPVPAAVALRPVVQVTNFNGPPSSPLVRPCTWRAPPPGVGRCSRGSSFPAGR